MLELRERAAKMSVMEKMSSESAQCYLMIAAQIIGFLVLTIYPILWSFKWAFYSYNGIPTDTYFVGLQNFITMFTVDHTYWKAWCNTLIFAFAKVPVELCFAMMMALLLNRKLRGSGFFRSMYYLPSVVSVVIVGLVFSNLFDYFGLINGLLTKFGLAQQPVDWFANKWSAMLLLVLGSIWNTFGINVMYFLAALSNVPVELYESARLDGASKTTIFFKVTLPLISPVFRVILMLSIIGTLGVNEYILVLTNGGPAGSTHTVMSYLTKSFMPGFATSSTPALGYGCAMSLVTTVLFGGIAILYDKFSKKFSTE